MQECINCGVRRFQWDGRISLITIMKEHNISQHDKIEVFIRRVENKGDILS